MHALPRPLKWPPVFPLEKSLVLWLPFDDRSGARAYDRSGKGNHGTLYGPTWAAGRRGGALSFNGINDYVDLGDILRFETGDFTVSFWVKYTSGTWAFITKSWAFHGISGWGIAYESGVSYEDGVSVALQGRIGNPANNPLTPNVWTLVTVTFDRDDKMKTYLNAIMTDSYDISSKQTITGTSDPLFIGRYVNSMDLKDIIDDVRVYNRALGAAEIKRHYESELPIVRH